ncbi:MAG TPA: glycosyltransferase [Ohtaekwangia sp.]
MKLTLLIPTLNEPFYINRLARLLEVLKPQVDRWSRDVEYRINDAGRFMTTGQKRNLMVANCDSDYFAFIDSDDLVSADYLEEIMFALSKEPDCVTMCGWMTTDGKDKRDWTIKLGSEYYEKNRHYYRWPNHLAVMKRELVSKVKFPDKVTGEDYDWSKRIHEMKLLKTEVHITKQIYFYDFVSTRNRK